VPTVVVRGPGGDAHPTVARLISSLPGQDLRDVDDALLYGGAAQATIAH